MKKFGTWVLNHLVLILGLLTLLITAGIIGAVMYNSYTSYKAYEVKFDEADLEIRSLSAAQPQLVEFNDEYQTRYANELSLPANGLKVTTSQESYIINDYIDLTEKGGSIAIALKLEKRSFVDIDFVISSSYSYVEEEVTYYGVKDLLSNISISVNGETVEEEDINLANSGNGAEFHHLIMAGFALPEGDVTVDIKSVSGKAMLMPQIQAVNFYSSQELLILEAQAE